MTGAPTWFTTLSGLLDKHSKANSYALATVDSTNQLPHVRYIRHRLFYAETTKVPLLITTTDARSMKLPQVAQTAAKKGTDSSKAVEADVEIAWWFEEAGEQFRIQAKAHFLPSSTYASSDNGKQAHADLLSNFPFARILPPNASVSSNDDKAAAAWWESKRVEIFDQAMGNTMRASFGRSPAPGTEIQRGSNSEENPGFDEPGKLPPHGEVIQGDDEEKKRRVKFALDNFVLVAFEPTWVERLELFVTPNRRTNWIRSRGDEWEEKSVVP